MFFALFFHLASYVSPAYSCVDMCCRWAYVSQRTLSWINGMHAMKH